jgi:hypothetical protein
MAAVELKIRIPKTFVLCGLCPNGAAGPGAPECKKIDCKMLDAYRKYRKASKLAGIPEEEIDDYPDFTGILYE